MYSSKGLFITFEGGEGTGKTTQIELLKSYFEQLKSKVIITREPGGTPLAESLRALALKGEKIPDPLTELLLFTAARRDHIISLIKPHLSTGYHVICDRFVDSSLVFQGYCTKLGIDYILNLHKHIVQNFMPNVTFIFDLDPEIAKQRLQSRLQLNHYDQASIDWYRMVRAGYLELFNNYNSDKRLILIDANQSIDIVHHHIKASIEKILIGNKNT